MELKEGDLMGLYDLCQGDMKRFYAIARGCARISSQLSMENENQRASKLRFTWKISVKIVCVNVCAELCRV